MENDKALKLYVEGAWAALFAGGACGVLSFVADTTSGRIGLLAAMFVAWAVCLTVAFHSEQKYPDGISVPDDREHVTIFQVLLVRSLAVILVMFMALGVVLLIPG